MRISLLIDSPLATFLQALGQLDGDVRKEINTQTKKHALDIWAGETREQATTRLESRLAGSARVGVTSRNLFLRTGSVGKLSTGTPIGDVSRAIGFGVNPGKIVQVLSRKGKQFTRRMGSRFRPNNRAGYVHFPAASASIARVGALWIQTAVRTVHEKLEGATRG